MSLDPNKERNDPMMPEYWQLGEDLQDKIQAAGYESPTVDGIAVDVHDLLQASATIEQELIPRVLDQMDLRDKQALIEKLETLRFEFDHIAWHCQAASNYLSAAIESLKD